MLADEVEECRQDVAETGNEAHLGGGHALVLVVLLEEAQPLVQAVVKQGLQVALAGVGHVPRQALDPCLHIRPPPQLHRVLKRKKTNGHNVVRKKSIINQKFKSKPVI